MYCDRWNEPVRWQAQVVAMFCILRFNIDLSYRFNTFFFFIAQVLGEALRNLFSSYWCRSLNYLKNIPDPNEDKFEEN